MIYHLENFKDKRICVVGLGYVGLTFAVTLADIGFKVFGIEINQELLKSIKKGVPHFFEPGLDGTLKKVLKTKNLLISKQIPKSEVIDVFVITVGTPIDKNKKTITEMIFNVSKEIASVLKDNDLIIFRSTVEIGSTRKICKQIFNKTNKKYKIAFCPERTLEGNALKELRILPQIIGADDLETRARCASFFSFITPTVVQVSNLETAEVIKLIDNCQRDVQFALSNEVALLSDQVGISANEVINAGKLAYPRTNLPIPGPVGGPCLEKDTYILKNGLKKENYEPKIITTARKFNELLPKIILKKLKKYCASKISPKRSFKIVISGVAFKGRPETNDLRGTMALPIFEETKKHFPNSKIFVYDPVVKMKSIKELFNVGVIKDIEESFIDSTLYIIANNHPIFSSMPISNYSNLMKKPGIIFDFWNNFSSLNLLFPNGVDYIGLGELGVKTNNE